MKFLGIDYGTKRVGLAVSDQNGRLAFPKEIVKNNGELWKKLEAVIASEGVKEIVVGESMDFAGLPNALQREIEFFISKLEKKFKLLVHREKEFLTTVEARRYKEGENGADAGAAALILQRYLDRKNNKSND
ncbi:MAG TPA: Holliday junction resolvase RuvX [Candidatus Paceibacterota bacterium]